MKLSAKVKQIIMLICVIDGIVWGIMQITQGQWTRGMFKIAIFLALLVVFLDIKSLRD